MKKHINDVDYKKLKELFCECFGESEPLAEEILGYAREYGEIYYLSEEHKIVTMLCLAELETGFKYLFAVATSPAYRKKGLFAKNLALSISEDENIVCIPETKALFPLYEKLGFTQYGFILQTSIIGNGNLIHYQLTENVDLERLYSIYESSSFFPKKSKELFISTMKCHVLYGGTIFSDGSFYVLSSKYNNRNYITELCVPTGKESRFLELLMGCIIGKSTINLPTNYAPVLRDLGIRYKRNKLASFKSNNIILNDLYINTLYN